jgi:hypothetical protein
MGSSRLILAAGGALLWVTMGATAASADYRSGNCTTSGFTGGLGVYYSSYNSTNWRLGSTIYQLAPADSSSDLNNVKHVLYGGSATATLGSTNSADRDNVRHTLFNSANVVSDYFARKGGTAYVRETVTFDRFGTDPSCSKSVYLP